MKATVWDVYQALDRIAPFETQESWDNAGLLAGRRDTPVTGVICALDLTEGVIDEAVELGCELVVTHHPILFHARKNLLEEDPEGRLLAKLIRSKLALIAAHTNFDVAKGGVNDVLAADMGLKNVRELEQGLRIGAFLGSMKDLQEKASRALGGIDRVYGASSVLNPAVAVCGGAGGGFWPIAARAGAHVFLTGEVKYSDALDCVACGVALMACGHDRTERISVKALKTGLQTAMDALKYPVRVYESSYLPF